MGACACPQKGRDTDGLLRLFPRVLPSPPLLPSRHMGEQKECHNTTLTSPCAAHSCSRWGGADVARGGGSNAASDKTAATDASTACLCVCFNGRDGVSVREGGGGEGAGACENTVSEGAGRRERSGAAWERESTLRPLHTRTHSPPSTPGWDAPGWGGPQAVATAEHGGGRRCRSRGTPRKNERVARFYAPLGRAPHLSSLLLFPPPLCLPPNPTAMLSTPCTAVRPCGVRGVRGVSCVWEGGVGALGARTLVAPNQPHARPRVLTALSLPSPTHSPAHPCVAPGRACGPGKQDGRLKGGVCDKSATTRHALRRADVALCFAPSPAPSPAPPTPHKHSPTNPSATC